MCSRVCGIGPSAARHHQDRPVHLRRTGDHVLDVVRMPRAVHVRVVALLRLVLHVRRVDRDAARLLLRRRIDLVVVLRLAPELLRQDVRHRRRQRRLAMIHVPDRAHVHVRLGSLEFAFGHDCLPDAVSDHLVPMTRIERVTSPLPRECSTTELHGRNLPPGSIAGAGEGNRTLVISLEGFCSTIELHPPDVLHPKQNHRPPLPLHYLLDLPPARSAWWRGLDSNQRRRKANRFTVCPL